MIMIPKRDLPYILILMAIIAFLLMMVLDAYSQTVNEHVLYTYTDSYGRQVCSYNESALINCGYDPDYNCIITHVYLTDSTVIHTSLVEFWFGKMDAWTKAFIFYVPAAPGDRYEISYWDGTYRLRHPWDYNRNNKVDLSDFGTWIQEYPEPTDRQWEMFVQVWQDGFYVWTE